VKFATRFNLAVRYDCMHGCVVKCGSAKRARHIAQSHGHDEIRGGKLPFWIRSENATCRRLVPDDADEMILTDVLNA
jgi:hypothetical protein